MKMLVKSTGAISGPKQSDAYGPFTRNALLCGGEDRYGFNKKQPPK